MGWQRETSSGQLLRGPGYWFAPGVFSRGIGGEEGAVGKGPGKNRREEPK